MSPDAGQAAHDPLVPYYAAAWQWQTGARRAAVAGMDHLLQTDAAAADRELLCRADALAAIWLLDLGDRAGAAQHARKALAEAGPTTGPMAATVAYLAQPDSFAPPAQAPVKDYARAYALLLSRQFQPAHAKLRRDSATSVQQPGAERRRPGVLLAWAYEETGQWQRAEPLLRLTPLPQAAGLATVFASASTSRPACFSCAG